MAAVALAVDLVPNSTRTSPTRCAVLDATRRTDKPLAVLSNVASALDPDIAAQLRQAGVPGAGGHPQRPAGPAPSARPCRPARTRAVPADRPSAAGPLGGRCSPPGMRQGGPAARAARRLRDRHGPHPRRRPAAARRLAAADAIGYPVVLKTDEPGIAHKSDVGGVLLGIARPGRAGRRLRRPVGPARPAGAGLREAVPAGTELALGMARDPDLGPLVVVGAGGVLVELLADRAVALPPVEPGRRCGCCGRSGSPRCSAGVRGQPAADLDAVAEAVTGVSEIACELGDELEALDVNPLICGPAGAVAVDALALPRPPPGAGH